MQRGLQQIEMMHSVHIVRCAVVILMSLQWARQLSAATAQANDIWQTCNVETRHVRQCRHSSQGPLQLVRVRIIRMWHIVIYVAVITDDDILLNRKHLRGRSWFCLDKSSLLER